MDLDGLEQDEPLTPELLSALREQFPVTDEWAYLNHAAHGPFSKRTVEAINRVAQVFSYPPTMNADEREGAITTARENIATLVNGSPERVAFVATLADAMSLCAAGMDWRSGDNVVIPREEFPSVVYPFMNLERYGVQVRFVEKDERGFTSMERIAAAIDERTRALVISHVEFLSGFRNDLDEIGRLCRERNILSIVDATQSMGPIPIDAEAAGIDIVAAHGYKWLMASFGIAAIHFSERALEEIAPVYVGRLSVTKGFEDLDYELDWRPGAHRYQTGGMNWISLAALNASAELVLQVGSASTDAHTLRLTDRLLSEAAALGYQPTSCLDPARRSCIVSFSTGDHEQDAEVVQTLLSRNVAVSLRGHGVRVSPYFYNNDDDIDRLLTALPRR